MGSPSKPNSDPTLDAINKATLARLTREEETIQQEEEDRQEMLASGRVGRTSLLSKSFTGFRAGGSVVASAKQRQDENRAKRSAFVSGQGVPSTVVPRDRSNYVSILR